MDDPNVSLAKTRQMLKTSPFPRFERQGLLDLSEDEKYFVVNPALMEALIGETKERLRKLVMERVEEHFKKG